MRHLKEFIVALLISWAVFHAMGAYGLVMSPQRALASIQGGK